MTDEEKFVEDLYEEANEQLKEVYKEQKEIRNELLQEIAMIMLTYTIIDGVMSISSPNKDSVYKKISKMIIIRQQYGSKKEIEILNNILESTVKKTFNFYSYNADLKDIRKIIESNFKGKHFSQRIWENENEVTKYLHKQVKNFLNGKINVNQIKKDIEKTFNTSAYNAKRLVTTEVSRCQNEAFISFCKETGVKKIKRNETLDSKTCEECRSFHGKIFDLDKAPGIIHPLCRGFNEVYE
ncbi:minor capsid protein [Clostridioides difficile]|jgi:SPP1 gp7 family putative phage head morphogenesis protein|uniref:minor capsid protein n=1 Tax=Clostridioides difficile TaxID=1496 RepID=UPI00097FE5D2|nr:minor capsid protein [Clostridioides difficile]SJP48355.1 NAD+--asparagine ADP-ribosyltransferase [Clostridioides difficile]DAL24672.1 MAG TPA_asm: minor capsid protein [Caudoviricetes sp.]